ncbi:adenosylhomocysteine nucleosidase [Marinococcus luteus]|uniref:5'-methylthioadenosine/S-adenosylhomocysteine nucleosidase n=1 Tax=Marinococcus luteus TaxID=1122204 RepID=A0A1H2S565_9BACI|nr:5'-methylthioadenosine/S-adenosylhomocysteine nucleosidase [Marinococcus luteus]SDW26615.1 adenosylhomocysteine nucleosidase [Marinococcus luteus]
MRLGIIGAMKEEVEYLKSLMENIEEKETGGCFFSFGRLNGHEVILLQSGIGKVNAAIATSLLIGLYKPEAVINTGSAGGFNPDLSVGDVVISTEVRYNDVDATVFGYEFGQVPNMPAAYPASREWIEKAEAAALQVDLNTRTGLILSGDSFMSKTEQVDSLKAHFDEPQCAEMEAGAIAQVCYRFSCPFVVIRSLSDIAGKEAKQSYDEFLKHASKQSADMVIALLAQA